MDHNFVSGLGTLNLKPKNTYKKTLKTKNLQTFLLKNIGFSSPVSGGTVFWYFCHCQPVPGMLTTTSLEIQDQSERLMLPRCQRQGQ